MTKEDSKRVAIIELGVSETGLSEAILEKDLWVCYLLDYLFHRSEFKDSIIFKGGTSLSKAFGLIERFSEDVDLILDWRLIGYGLNEPWEERSNTKQDKFKLETIERTDGYLANTFVPSLEAGLSAELGIDTDVRMGDAEETVLFAYPRLFSSEATLDVVKLEIGPLAAWTPSQPATITSYLAELHPQLFTSPSTVVATAAPERTFWEKATILHQEANRPEGKAMPRRYARHYYDMYKLGHSDVAERAIARPELLAKVVAFKEKFYRTPWSKLPDAKPGTLKLSPQPERLAELKADYDSMCPMIFGDAPALEEVVAFMGELEGRINEQ
ncbi:MAG: nucleotidyl transferase AbiEii/AbiGii toxin family protein [Actinomycetota bacterium]|nr:nucleotidyl transferase AbiEii/AbiGii toxin family protein [Actinomycetota bacterium]